MDKKWGSSPHKKPKPHVAVYSERAISTNTFVELKKDTFSRFNKYILQFGQKMRQRSPSEAPTTCRCLRAACCCRQIVILNHFYTSLSWQSADDQLKSWPVLTSWTVEQLTFLTSWPVGQEFEISILWIIELFVADQSEESEVKENLNLTTSAVGVKCRSTIAKFFHC